MLIRGVQEQREVTLEVARDQELLSDVLVTLLAQAFGNGGIGKEKPNLVGRALNRMG